MNFEMFFFFLFVAHFRSDKDSCMVTNQIERVLNIFSQVC